MAKKEKLPQNMQHLLMEIGEKSVLYRLFLLTIGTNWEVYQNLGEHGCDIVMLNNKKEEKVKIEVKTRQNLYSTSKKRTNSQFILTKNEYDSANFLIAYWYENNDFFIIPKENLSKTSSNNKPLYRLNVNKKKDGSYNDIGQEYCNRWDIIEDIVKKK